jgi:hypothetical protein
MEPVNIIQAMFAAFGPNLRNNDYMDNFHPEIGATPYKVVVPEFTKTHGKPVIVYCLPGNVRIGKGRFAVFKPAHKVWYVLAERYSNDSGNDAYRPKGNATIQWANVVVGQSHEKVLRRFISTLAKHGVPVMK